MKNFDYFYITRLSFKTQSEYRGNIIFDTTIGLIPMLAIIALYKTIYTNTGEIGGLTLNKTITYLILARFIILFLSPDFHWNIHEEIRYGELSKYLLRPISYFKYWLCKDISNKLCKIMYSIIPYIFLVLIYLKDLIVIDYKNCFLFFITFILAYMIYFLFFYTVSMLTFYFNNITAFFYTLEIIIEFFSGAMIPLSFLKGFSLKFINLLPFKYIVDFPINILLGRVSYNEIIFGIFVQFIWTLVLYLMSRVAWKNGISKYEGVGI
ncbi:ABC-2 family transporter protein [Peptostreptococcaceae bacterium AGR-M142]